MESLLDIGRQLVPKNIVMAAATSQVRTFRIPFYDTTRLSFGRTAMACVCNGHVDRWPAAD